MAKENSQQEKEKFDEDLYQEAKPGSIKLDSKTRNALEGHLEKTVRSIIWDHKSINDKDERELAIKTKDLAEKTFAILYADNPMNAKMKWQNFASRAPTKEMIDRVEGMVIEKDFKKAIPRLVTESNELKGSVEDIRLKSAGQNRNNEIANMESLLGDLKQRSRDYNRKAISGMVEKEQEVDGLTFLKAFVKGYTRVGNDFLDASREKKKAKKIEQSIKEIYGQTEEALYKKLKQKINGEYAHSVVYGKTAGMATIKLVKDLAMKAAAALIKKMAGSDRNAATQAAPKPVQLLLAAPPLRITDDRGRSGGIGMA